MAGNDVGQKPFHERPLLINQCAIAAFNASFGERADMRAWDKQTSAFRASFRNEAKAVLKIAWDAATLTKDTHQNG